MFQLPVLFRTLIVAGLALLLGGCLMPVPQDEPPPPRPVEPPVAESAVLILADLGRGGRHDDGPAAVINQNANVRTGPGTDYAVAYWLTAGDEVTVVGRNDDGTWLQIEHQDRPGWISATLTGIATEGAAPPPAPAPEPVAEPKPTVEPTPAVGCTRLHTVNPNETRLVQITDWLGLDLAATAALNGIDADAPLTAGTQLCLAAGPATAPVTEPEPDPFQLPVLPHNPLFIDVGRLTTCAVKADATAVCWYAAAGVPPAWTFSMVGSGDDVTYGLLTDGTVASWGRNVPGGVSIPVGTFTQISVGTTHGCGLRTDGTVSCWFNGPNRRPIPPAGTFKAVSAGHLLSCGIRADDTLACWGSNSNGQALPPAGTFKAVSSGNAYACGLRTDGTIACWGNRGSASSSPPGGTFSMLAAGDFHACAIRTNGSLACWGDNTDGQSSPPAGTFKAVSAGLFNTCAVRTDGAMLCWGLKW